MKPQRFVHLGFTQGLLGQSTMIRRIAISALCALSLAGPATAAVREVPQSEMRSIVNAGQGIGLQQVLKTLARNVEGEAVDVHDA